MTMTVLDRFLLSFSMIEKIYQTLKTAFDSLKINKEN